MKNVAEKIRLTLIEKNLSKAELGRKLGGISGQLIGRYAYGEINQKVDFYRNWKKVSSCWSY